MTFVFLQSVFLQAPTNGCFSLTIPGCSDHDQIKSIENIPTAAVQQETQRPSAYKVSARTWASEGPVEGFGLQSFSIDLMHTWHLGPIQPLVSLALHCCLDAQILNPNAFSLNADRQKVGLMAIKSELLQWYKQQRKDPEWLKKGTEVASLYCPYILVSPC